MWLGGMAPSEWLGGGAPVVGGYPAGGVLSMMLKMDSWVLNRIPVDVHPIRRLVVYAPYMSLKIICTVL